MAKAGNEMSPRLVAESNTILRGLVGSTVHGLVLAGTDDRDEMGVCVEPRRYVVGFRRFEQWVYRSAAEREGREGARSQQGDLDLVVYSLRKWARLALQGNPTVLLLLYLPDDALVTRTAVGEELQELAPSFGSRQAGRRSRMSNSKSACGCPMHAGNPDAKSAAII